LIAAVDRRGFPIVLATCLSRVPHPAGRISDEIGWKRKADVAQLEAARKETGKVYWETKKALLAKQKKAKADTAEGPYAAVLAQHGY